MNSSKSQSYYQFRDFNLNVAERLLVRDDASVPLTPKAFDVLALLVERGGRLVEKDELLRVCWEDAFVEEANVARVVHSLRKSLGEDRANKFIETVPKKGYRFIAEVKKVTGAPGSPEAFPDENENGSLPTVSEKHSGQNGVPREENGKPENAFEFSETNSVFPSTGEPDFEPEDEASLTRPGSRLLVFVAALFIVAVLVTGVFVYRRNSAESGNNQSRSIAVLPLKPINIDNRDSIYELGIAESLILKLSSGRELTVRPLSSTRRYLEPEQNPVEAGREQQVDFVLSSNYQIAAGKIRVTAQLINVETGQVEEVYKTENVSGNVFAMQDAIANDIGNPLLARFGNGKTVLIAKRGTANESAYRLYLQAAFIFDQWNKSEIGRAIDYLERAVQIDPNYAEAYAMLAYAYRFFASKTLAPTEQSAKARAAVEKALALDPHLPDAHAVSGLLKFSYERDLAGAEKDYRRAIELNPESPMARALYAYYLMGVGRFEEAIGENKIAMEIEPGSLSHQITCGMILYYAHRFDDADAHYRRILEKDRYFTYAYFWLWLVSDLRGEEAQAYDWFIRHQTQMRSSPELIALYQNAYQKAGWKGILRENIAQDEQKLETEDNAGLLYEIACFSARLGDRRKALDYLEKAAEARSSSMIFIKVDPYLDSLHGDPRFEKLAETAAAN